MICVACASAYLARERLADACSCLAVADSFRPADGTTDVPRNTIVVAATQIFNPPQLLRVLDPLGNPVAGTTSEFIIRFSSDGWLVFVPAEPLAATAVHSIELAGSIQASFVTSDSEFAESPGFDGIDSMSAVLRAAGDMPSPCWRNTDSLDELTLRLAGLGKEVSHMVVEVRTADASTPFFRTLVPREVFSAADTIVLSTAECDIAGPDLTLGETYCASATAYDRVGNASPARDACAMPTECIGESPPWGRCAGGTGCNASSGTPRSFIVLLALGLLLARRRGG